MNQIMMNILTVNFMEESDKSSMNLFNELK